MKKSLLLLSLLFGATATQAATVEDICGNYIVNSFTGWESYWWHKTTDWQEFSYDNYIVEIEQVEGNTVVLTGLLEADITGEYDAENSCIVFPYQDPYGSGTYSFCKEIVGEDSNWIIDPAESVIAPIDVDGNITFDDWTIVYDYGNGTYFYYFSGVKCQLSSVTTYEAGWYFYDDQSEDENEPTISETRTLCQFNDGSYRILNAFGTENEKDVLNFTLTENNITFQGLKSYQGCKYLYYNNPDYVYIYDSEYGEDDSLGQYSSYEVEDGTNYVYFYIYGTYGIGYVCLTWENQTSAINQIAVDSFVAPTQYFNLQGMSVNQDNLRPGIYIVRQGNQARKVLVK